MCKGELFIRERERERKEQGYKSEIEIAQCSELDSNIDTILLA